MKILRSGRNNKIMDYMITEISELFDLLLKYRYFDVYIGIEVSMFRGICCPPLQGGVRADLYFFRKILK
jgi:hypothetical protein